MRDAFIQTLLREALEDPSILLLSGDLGFGVLNEFRSRVPDQFLNVGVAEQNMTGVGAGLALAGFKVLTYSIGNFPTLRCLEQIRNDVCYHQANVKVVTVGGGLAYGALGPSHFATEDLAILRALPDMMVVAPADPIEVEQLLPQILAYPGPVYLRLGRAGEPLIHREGAEVILGRPTEVLRGTDGVTLLTTGGMLSVAMAATELLAEEDVHPRVVSVHTLRPLDAEEIVELASGSEVVITCEEHSVIGGLGGAVAEILLEAGVSTRFRRFGLPPTFPEGVGDQEHMRAVNRIDAESLRNLVRALLTQTAPLPVR